MDRYHFAILKVAKGFRITALDALGTRLLDQEASGQARRDSPDVLDSPLSVYEVEAAPGTSYLMYVNADLSNRDLVYLVDQCTELADSAYMDTVEDELRVAQWQILRNVFPAGTADVDIIQWDWGVAPVVATAATQIEALNALNSQSLEQAVDALTGRIEWHPARVIDVGNNTYHVRETSDGIVAHRIEKV